MEIKKGNRFVCVRDVVMEGGYDEVAYIKGNVYVSEEDGCITNELRHVSLWWFILSEKQKYFIPYSKLDRVYTYSTPVLENLWNCYKGKKNNVSLSSNYIFTNCNTAHEPGWFWAERLGDDYFLSRDYTYLSEQAFIEFMDLGKYIGGLNMDSGEALEDSNDFKEITDSIAELLQYKNDKYGNSALDPLEIFGGKCKVGSRLDDKLARIKNSESLKKNDVADLIGYCVLICKENNWKDFSEFMD